MKGRMIGFAAVFTAAMASPLPAQLFGPGKFKVEQTDDRFSTDGLATYAGHNNRISKKSVAGGVHVDGKGMFVEPVAIKRKTDGAIVSVGFFVHNETDYDTTYGSPNNIGTPNRITFLPDDGQPISVPIGSGGSKWSDRVSYNTISKSASAEIQETGFAELPIEQFHRISRATRLAVKIEGSERSVVYEERDISKAFVTNLQVFDTTYVGRP